MLVLIAHEQRDLGGAFPVKLAQPPDGEDFVLARVRRSVIGDHCNLAIVVDKTDSSQPIVSNSLAELGPLKIAEKDAALRKRSVELHHQRFILRADRPQTTGVPSFIVHDETYCTG